MRKNFYSTIALALVLFLGYGVANAQSTYYMLLNKKSYVLGLPQQTTPTKEVIENGKNDVLSAVQTLPFPIKFYGDTVRAYKVSDNGYITFDTTQTTSFNSSLALPAPLSQSPRNALFVFWSDFEMSLNTTSQGQPIKSNVVTFTEGTAPNRRHVIQYRYAVPKGKTATRNYLVFAVVLHENNDIEVVHNGGALLDGQINGAIGAQKDFNDATCWKNSLVNFSATASSYSLYSGTQPEYDLKANSLGMYRYTSTGTNTPFALQFTNFGKTDLSTIKINYEVEGIVTSNTINITTPIPNSGGVGQINVGNMQFANKGMQNVKVWVSEPNGNTDLAKLVTPEDDTLNRKIYVSGSLTPRRVLVEEFTSATCGPCAAVNPSFNALLKQNYKDLSIVKYQCYIPVLGDPMYAYAKSYVDRRAQYYGVNSAPSARVDGLYYAGHPANLVNTPAILTGKVTAVGGAVSFDITPTENGTRHDFDIKVKSNITHDTSNLGGSLILHAAVVENEINYLSAPGSNGEKKFEDVLREMLPNGDGTNLVSMTEGEERTVKVSYVRDDATVKKAQLRLVVWVQNSRTGDVLNSWMSWTDFSLGLNEVNKANINSTIFPNPSNGVTNFKYNLENSGRVSINITDVTGKTVANVLSNQYQVAGIDNMVNFDASTLGKGIYFVNFVMDGKVSAKKLIVE